MPPTTNKPPKGYEKKSWQELVSDFAAKLTDYKSNAEGDAIQLQINIKDTASLIPAARKYNRFAGKYNGASNWLQGMLRGGKKPKADPPDTGEIDSAYAIFEAEADKLLAAATHGPKSLHLRLYLQAASPIPSISDIAKLFDSIMGAIEWFLQRSENERYALADLLQNTSLREWTQVTKPPEPPVHTTPPGAGGGKGGGTTDKPKGTTKKPKKT